MRARRLMAALALAAGLALCGAAATVWADDVDGDGIDNAIDVRDSAPADAEGDTPELQEELVLDLRGGVTMVLVLIPAGEFVMGSESGGSNEKPVHHVRISKPLYVGKYEVTQAQWKAVMRSNPSRSTGDDLPVEGVSWDDCREYCRKVEDRTGVAVRLPTEAEWEYACRAGSTGVYSFGDSTGRLGDYAWHEGNSGRRAHPVGKRDPNALGLHDMHGNLWEWCEDWRGDYAFGTQVDPTGPATGWVRVLRGGSWNGKAVSCRSASRYGLGPGDCSSDGIGFRIAVGTQ